MGRVEEPSELSNKPRVLHWISHAKGQEDALRRSRVQSHVFSFLTLSSVLGCSCDFGHILTFHLAFFFATPVEEEKAFGEQQETHSECVWLLWELQTEIFL